MHVFFDDEHAVLFSDFVSILDSSPWTETTRKSLNISSLDIDPVLSLNTVSDQKLHGQWEDEASQLTLHCVWLIAFTVPLNFMG